MAGGLDTSPLNWLDYCSPLPAENWNEIISQLTGPDAQRTIETKIIIINITYYVWETSPYTSVGY
jgi:hypothetical protein